MSKREQGQDKTGTEAKRLKKERSVDEAKTEIINEIIAKVEEIIKNSREGQDSTDGIAGTINEIFQPILDEFKDLNEENEDKKSFIGGLIKIFTILLSSIDKSLVKIKKIRVSTKIALDLWPVQKQQ